MSHEPLFGPGKHPMSLNDFYKQTVYPFMPNNVREKLFGELAGFIEGLSETGLVCEVWVDGSFLSNKEEPGDIDLTVVIDYCHFQTLSKEKRLYLLNTFFQKEERAYSQWLDVYQTFSVSDDHKTMKVLDRTSYWSGFWSTDREDNLKGYACIYIGHTDEQLQLLNAENKRNIFSSK